MRILAFHPGCHDSSAALFSDYKLLAAVDEERLTRRKGSGDGVPWLAMDEVLRIGGCSRSDVDAIVATRSFFPWQYLRYPFHKELDYRFRHWLGRDQKLRDLMVHCQLRHTADAKSVFRTGAFLDDHGFRPDTLFQFANHHEAHALASLFYTDWDDALLYTADGVGDNVSYSIRTLKNGQLDCHFGDDRWLLQRGPARSSLAWAYGYATKACGFTMFRHEGKLTGLAARGEPLLADDIASHFWVDNDGMISASFADDRAIERMIAKLCNGHARETIAASIQKVVEDLTLRSIQHWLLRTQTRHLGLAGGLFANVRLNRLLAEKCPIDEIFIYPAMSDGGLSVGAGLSFLLARDGLQTWLTERYRLDDLYFGFDYQGRIDDQFSYSGTKRPQPTRRDLAEAITEVLAGKAVSMPTTDVAGCLIARAVKPKEAGTITFTRDVAPILQDRCHQGFWIRIREASEFLQVHGERIRKVETLDHETEQDRQRDGDADGEVRGAEGGSNAPSQREREEVQNHRHHGPDADEQHRSHRAAQRRARESRPASDKPRRRAQDCHPANHCEGL